MWPIAIPPTWVMVMLLASIYTVLWRILFKDKERCLVSLWVISLLGFALGQMVGDLTASTRLLLGDVHLLEATVGSLLFLFIVSRLKA